MIYKHLHGVSGIYTIYHNGEMIYCGESGDIGKRVRIHVWSLNKHNKFAAGNHPTSVLCVDDMTISVEECCDRKQRLVREREIHSINSNLLSTINDSSRSKSISDGWANRTEEQRERTKKLKSEGGNGMYRGIYHTPKGDFHSSYKAAEANCVSFSTIQKWCKNPDVLVRASSNIIPNEWVGKTRRQNGFWFEPK